LPADLDPYRQRRDFDATPEPPPSKRPDERERPRFCIQRHDARSLHFDLRLEIDGVLRSWAVPKGVPLRCGPKRLAVQTEDHPLEYLRFEGVIPEGEYGAGRMTIWDAGEYVPERRSDTEWKVRLEGARLRGDYHLVRTGHEDGREEWLLFRSRAGGEGPPDPLPRFRALRPMVAVLDGGRPDGFDDPEWAFELKWDGYRALALVSPDQIELRSRRGLDLTGAYPDAGDLRRRIMCQEAVLDGEIVALDAGGRASFQRLQRGEGPIAYVVFDLLQVDGDWLLDRPWHERRAALAGALAPERGPALLAPDYVPGEGRALLAAARAREVEGVVAKRMDAPYRPGRRSGDWLKLKIRPEEELVIGGFTEGAGSRRGRVGALLVGRPEGASLRYVGHVGSGLSDDEAAALWGRLEAVRSDASPFDRAPRGDPPPRWVRPELRCTVGYAEETHDGRLRAPVFLGLLDDDGGGPEAPAIAADGDQDVGLAGRRIRLTNLGKVYWPGEGITKGDLLRHYLAVAPALVPHLAARAMILKRYPDGIGGDHFFQHNLPEGAPDWLTTAELARSERPGSSTNRYAVVDDLLSLLWVANLGAIDMNPWQSPVDRPEEPTQVLFDLDPAEGVPYDAVVETALLVREVLQALGLRGYPKTSGGSGMHVFVPVAGGLTYEVVRLFALVVARTLAGRRPELVTTSVRVADRGKRIYIDANQNGRGRSISSVYSIRPRPGAPVATPLRWDEVAPGLDPRAFTPEVVAGRLRRDGDLFAGVLSDQQDLASAAAELGPA